MDYLLFPEGDVEELVAGLGKLGQLDPAWKKSRVYARALGRQYKKISPKVVKRALKIHEEETVEVISSWLYDSIQPQAATTAVYFAAPITALKSKTLTNLTQARLIPFTEVFKITGIGAYIHPLMANIDLTDDPSDWDMIHHLTNGYWELKIGRKDYGESSIDMILAFHPVFCCCGSSSLGTACQVMWAQESPFVRNKGFWQFSRHVLLAPGVNFEVDVTWDVASDAANTKYLKIVLIGERKRPKQ